MRDLEATTRELQSLVQQAREGASLMRTIAKIRSTDVDSRAQPVGFDALAAKVDNITRRVSEIERSHVGAPGRPGAATGGGGGGAAPAPGSLEYNFVSAKAGGSRAAGGASAAAAGSAAARRGGGSLRV